MLFITETLGFKEDIFVGNSPELAGSLLTRIPVQQVSKNADTGTLFSLVRYGLENQQSRQTEAIKRK